MRLLERNEAGEIRLTKDFLDDEIPPYAILSHTWGSGEVLFKDLTDVFTALPDGTGTKLRYEKIRLCGDQALRDGLQYFWVDTCCIDKSNNTELQEAINSMFSWYRNSAKCYVYLADVSRPSFEADDETSQLHWKPAFRKSRWFARGWTLQELIAPASVEFFSKEGVKLGNKRSLGQSIYEITGIPSNAFQGGSFGSLLFSSRIKLRDIAIVSTPCTPATHSPSRMHTPSTGLSHSSTGTSTNKEIVGISIYISQCTVSLSPENSSCPSMPTPV